MPKISIVTPSFNQSQYLNRTIESVLNQAVDLEYIIVDGCSTDGSIDILKKYDSRAHIIIEKDEGQADAIAKGFSLASGDILGWLNSDDMYLPGTLEKVISAFDEDNEFIYGHVFIIDPVDKILRKRIAIPVEFNDLYYGMYIIPQEATFFSKKLYLESGGIDSSYEYAMDYDLWLRMSLLKTPRRIDDYLACFRFHKDQKTSNPKLYFDEVKRARRNLQGVSYSSKLKSFYSIASLKFRKLFANIKTSGVRETISDMINKQLGKLP